MSRGWVWPALLPLLPALPGCEPLPPPQEPGPHEPLVILREASVVTVRPFQGRVVTFRLVDANAAPVPYRTMQFAIPSEDLTGGAQLSPSAVRTDTQGTARIQVIAGTETPSRFHVVASADGASKEAYTGVRVSTREFADLIVRPFMDIGEEELLDIATYSVRLIEDCTCAARAARKNCGEPQEYSIAPGAWSETFRVPLDNVHVIVAEARNHEPQGGRVRGFACIDLAGATLSTRSQSRIEAYLHRWHGDPTGAFELISQLPPPDAAKATVARWGGLSRCALDPASLWLDCAIDALSGPQPGDPDDCRPDDEGAIGGRLLARRGKAIPSPTAGVDPCRDVLDELGNDSLDHQTMAMVPAAVLTDFQRAGRAIGSMFLADQTRPPIILRSNMTIASASTPDTFRIDHTIKTVTLNLDEFGSPALLPASYGLPALTAPFVAAALDPGYPRRQNFDRLEIGTHVFTLKLGTLSRAAFQDRVLQSLGAADIAAFVTGRFALAGNAAGSRRGCQALDELACGAVGEAAGCLLAACQAGLATLASELEGAFTRLDGPGLDLEFRSASLPMTDGAAGRIDKLGSSSTTWTGQYADGTLFQAKVQGQRTLPD